MSGCYFCESTADIQEHHILPQRFEGSDKESNTVDLCHDCHWKLERLYNKEFWEAIGVEDPRATKESHVTCSVHGCMEQATGRYHLTGHTGSTLAYRCDDHVPGQDDDGEEPEGSDDKEYGKNEWLDKLVDTSTASEDDEAGGGYTQQIEFGFNNLLGGEPVTRERLHETIVGHLIERVNVLEENSSGLVTGVRLSTGHSVYSARHEESDEDWIVSFEGVLEEE